MKENKKFKAWIFLGPLLCFSDFSVMHFFEYNVCIRKYINPSLIFLCVYI